MSSKASGSTTMTRVAGLCSAMTRLIPAIRPPPEAFDDTRRSLEAGERVAHPQGAPSICDALMAPMPGELTWPINRRLAGAATVTDAEVAETMRFAFRWLKLVIEPGGAVSLAALLSGKVEAKGLTTGIVLSGGNVDPGLFAEIIEDRFRG